MASSGDRSETSATDELWRSHLKNVGEFIRAQRAFSQLSQRQLARMADLSDAYLSQIERGLHEPSMTVLRSLAESLGIRADELILYAAGLPTSTGAVTTEEAIRTDVRLSGSERAALLGVLQSFLQAKGGDVTN